MGNWSSKAVVLPPIEFDGDSIVFSVKRLLTEDMLVLMRNFNQGTGKLEFSNPLEVCQTAQLILPKYVTDIQGMSSADGIPVTAEEFIKAASEFYFVPLMGALLAALIDVSTVGTQAKN